MVYQYSKGGNMKHKEIILSKSIEPELIDSGRPRREMKCMRNKINVSPFFGESRLKNDKDYKKTGLLTRCSL